MGVALEPLEETIRHNPVAQGRWMNKLVENEPVGLCVEAALGKASPFKVQRGEFGLVVVEGTAEEHIR